MKTKIIAVLLVALLFIIILIQNSKAVTLQLLFWNITIPLVALLLIVFVVGFFLGFVAIHLWHWFFI